MSRGKKPPPPPSANPAIQAVNTPSLFEKLAEERLRKFSAWENQEGPRDILDAPGIGDMVDIYGSAESLANKRRMDNPAMALSGGGNANYAAQLDSQDRQNRYDERAQGLSRGLQGLKAEAYGLGGSAAELEANRRNNYAQLSLGQENAYYNRPKKQSFWSKLGDWALSRL